MAETFHERLRRLGRAKDYAGMIATLRTPFPAESGADVGAERVHQSPPGMSQEDPNPDLTKDNQP